jgi:hypothetical protein
VSYELLERHLFPRRSCIWRGLRRLAAKAGKPEVYHEDDHDGVSRAYRRAAVKWELRRLSRVRGAKSGSFLQGIVEQVLEPAVLQSRLPARTFILPRPTD